MEFIKTTSEVYSSETGENLKSNIENLTHIQNCLLSLAKKRETIRNKQRLQIKLIKECEHNIYALKNARNIQEMERLTLMDKASKIKFFEFKKRHKTKKQLREIKDNKAMIKQSKKRNEATLQKLTNALNIERDANSIKKINTLLCYGVKELFHALSKYRQIASELYELYNIRCPKISLSDCIAPARTGEVTPLDFKFPAVYIDPTTWGEEDSELEEINEPA